MSEPMVNQRLLNRLKSFMMVLDSVEVRRENLQGCFLRHSYLRVRKGQGLRRAEREKSGPRCLRRESGEDEEEEGDDEVGGESVEPDLDGQRRQEREQRRRFLLRPLVQDADAQVEERLGEVDDLGQADEYRREQTSGQQ